MIIKNSITVEDYQTLHRSVGWKILDDTIVKASIDNSHIILAAYDDEKILGMVRLVSDSATHGLLTDMIVLPQYQRHGVGKELIEELINQVQKFVDDKDQFLIELVPTKGTEEFYKKCGFKVDNTALLGAYKWFKNRHIYGL